MKRDNNIYKHLFLSSHNSHKQYFFNSLQLLLSKNIYIAIFIPPSYKILSIFSPSNQFSTILNFLKIVKSSILTVTFDIDNREKVNRCLYNLLRCGETSGHRGITVLFVEFAVKDSWEPPTRYVFRMESSASSLEKLELSLLPQSRVALLLPRMLDTVTGPYMINPRG